MVFDIFQEDKVITKDNRTIRVQKVRKQGDQIYRVEGVIDSDPCPMMQTIMPDNILRVIPNDKSKFRQQVKSGGK